MPGKLQCNSCKGIYPDTTSGNEVGYFHVCPPQIVNTPEITDVTHTVTVPVTFKPTPNPRNENVIPDPANPGTYKMIAAGSGTTPV